MIYLINIIKALLLLFLLISTNFFVDTINCDLQSMLYKNIFIKHIIIYFLIFFSIDLTVDADMSPITIGKNSLVIYIFYLLLTKQTPAMFVINIILMIVVYILSLQITYDNKNNITSTFDYNLIIEDFKKIIIITLAIGFVLYHNEYFKNKNNYIDFIFTNNTC